MRGYAPRCTRGRVGRTTKSTLKEQRQTPIYLGWTHCTKGRQWAITDATESRVITAPWKNTNLFSARFFSTIWSAPPSKSVLYRQNFITTWMSVPYSHVLHQCEWGCSPARQSMHSNYLQFCLRTPNSHTFKFKRLYWQWKGGRGGEDNKNTEALRWVQAMQ